MGWLVLLVFIGVAAELRSRTRGLPGAPFRARSLRETCLH